MGRGKGEGERTIIHPLKKKGNPIICDMDEPEEHESGKQSKHRKINTYTWNPKQSNL